MICMAVKISALRYLIANCCRAVMLTFYFYAMEPERSYGWIPGPLKDKWSDYKVIVVSRPSDYAAFLQPIESSGKYERSELCRGFVVYRRGGISQREGY